MLADDRSMRAGPGRPRGRAPQVSPGPLPLRLGMGHGRLEHVFRSALHAFGLTLQVQDKSIAQCGRGLGIEYIAGDSRQQYDQQREREEQLQLQVASHG